MTSVTLMIFSFCKGKQTVLSIGSNSLRTTAQCFSPGHHHKWGDSVSCGGLIEIGLRVKLGSGWVE